MKTVLFALTALSTLALQAADIAGEYTISGKDPYDNKTYGGKATITQSGKIYSAKWEEDNGDKFFGTGLLNGDVIAFIFDTDTDSEDAESGLQVYKVDNGVLRGEWTFLEGDKVGTETLTPKK